MAYISGGLSVIENTLSGQGNRTWLLQTADTVVTARAANYISDAQDRGMQIGDLVRLVRYTTFTDQYTFTTPILAMQLMVVMSVASTGADLSDGTAISVVNT